MYNDENLCLQRGGVERKKLETLILAYQLRIRNPLLKNGFRIRIPKLAKNWADSGSGLPTLYFIPDTNMDQTLKFLRYQNFNYCRLSIF